MLTAKLVQQFAPHARADVVQGLVDGWPRIYAAGITTPQRLQHFMAELCHESSGFTALEENLNYTAGRLCAVWPTRFPTAASAARFALDPRALANKVYGGRYGNTGPDDGWLFRGGGLIQTTFRSNYRMAGFEDDPEALRRMPGALDAALEFWTRNRINALVDTGDLIAERRKINGGTNGLENVRILLARASTVFTRVVPPAASPVAKGGATAVSAPRRLAGPASVQPARLIEPQRITALARLGGWLRRALG